LTKAELINLVAEKTGFTKKDSSIAVDAFIEAISEALSQGERVALVGFGTFEVRERRKRTGRNPQTGEKIDIPARRVPVFKAGKVLKRIVS